MNIDCIFCADFLPIALAASVTTTMLAVLTTCCLSIRLNRMMKKNIESIDSTTTTTKTAPRSHQRQSDESLHNGRLSEKQELIERLLAEQQEDDADFNVGRTQYEEDRHKAKLLKLKNILSKLDDDELITTTTTRSSVPVPTTCDFNNSTSAQGVRFTQTSNMRSSPAPMRCHDHSSTGQTQQQAPVRSRREHDGDLPTGISPVQTHRPQPQKFNIFSGITTTNTSSKNTEPDILFIDYEPGNKGTKQF